MTADPRAVEIIAAELARHTLGLGNKCACGRTVAEDDLALPEWDQHLASASAAALTAAGWSLLGGPNDPEMRGDQTDEPNYDPWGGGDPTETLADLDDAKDAEARR